MPSAPGNHPESAFEHELRELNAALLVSSLHQHELTEQAQRAEAASRKSEEVAVLARQAIEKAYLALRARSATAAYSTQSMVSCARCSSS